MAKRLRDKCKLREDEKLWRVGRGFLVRDLPWTEATPSKATPVRIRELGSDCAWWSEKQRSSWRYGDGRQNLSCVHLADKEKRNQDFAFMDQWYPIQVKQKDKAGRPDIDQFETAMMRENRTKGFFVSFDFTSDARWILIKIAAVQADLLGCGRGRNRITRTT
jgi:hypothetical protein